MRKRKHVMWFLGLALALTVAGVAWANGTQRLSWSTKPTKLSKTAYKPVKLTGSAVLTSFKFTFTKPGYASARCPAKTLTLKSVFMYAASGSADAPTQSPSATIKCQQR